MCILRASDDRLLHLSDEGIEETSKGKAAEDFCWLQIFVNKRIGSEVEYLNAR